MLSSLWNQYGSFLVWIYSASTTVLVIVVSFLIFMEKRNPYKTIAWLAILNVFPVLGLIIYLMFGQNLRKRKKVKTKYINEFKQLQQLVDHQIDSFKTDPELARQSISSKAQLINLLLRNANAPFTRSNSASILTDGQKTFQCIFDELEKAQHHIHLEYYILKADNTGQKLKEILIRKARSGVKIRVLYDAVGCWKLPKKYIRELKDAGVLIKPFLPVVMPFINNKLNYRNHRKIIVIDGHIGFLGGLNIGDEYLGYHPKLGKWRDTHLKLEGTAVHFLQVIFMLDWEFVTGETINDQAYLPEIKNCDGKLVQIAASGPDSDWETVHQSYFALITSAQKSIKITTPYLVPDEGILLALKTAALSGIDVKIIFPGRPDTKVVYWASQSYFDELMEAGVEIYMYQPGFIHAKTVSVDGEVASLGSANLDMRSFMLNFEVNAMLYDKELVSDLDQSFAEDLANSIKIAPSDYANRPLPLRIRQSAARLLSPLL